jgi:lipoprotein signal peptidase
LIALSRKPNAVYMLPISAVAAGGLGAYIDPSVVHALTDHQSNQF